MQFISLSARPSQVLACSLAGQRCGIDLRQKTTGLFLSLYVNDALVVGGVVCVNGELIVRDAYLGFAGDLVFYDMQGADDPFYTGLGTRWILAYIEPWQIAA